MPAPSAYSCNRIWKSSTSGVVSGAGVVPLAPTRAPSSPPPPSEVVVSSPSVVVVSSAASSSSPHAAAINESPQTTAMAFTNLLLRIVSFASPSPQ